MSPPTQVWVSSGLPSAALENFLATVAPRSWRHLPLVAGVTVWDEPAPEKLTVAIACPNRLGAFESLPPQGDWDEVWWWADPLDAGRSAYGSAPRVRKVEAPALLPPDRSLPEASERSGRAADYLARRIRQLRGVRIPSVPCGRRFPVLLPVSPAPILEGKAEEIMIPEPVDGWPGLLICEVSWWQTATRLDQVVEAVARASRGETPLSLAPAVRVWSSFR
ncbi:MAG: hypothetical protein J4G00_06960 [Actinomycetia bacterium]|nr:hypothetical protein [Actinomycetes bacterium]